MSYRNVYIAMTVTALLWSGAFIAGKMAGTVFMPLTLTFLRFLFALPFIFIMLKLAEPGNFCPTKEQFIPLAVLGIVGTLGYHFFFFLALRHTTAVNSSLIGAANPMVTTLLAVLFFKEKITASRGAGIILSLLGVFCVITGLDYNVISGIGLNRGDLYMAAGVLCFSTYALLSRKYMAKYQITPLKVSAYTFLTCTLLSLLLGAAIEQPLQQVQAAGMKVWLEIAYMAVFASVIGYYLQLDAISKIGAPKAAMFINLVPVFTIILAGIMLNETVDMVKIFSAGLIIAGVYLASRPENKMAET